MKKIVPPFLYFWLRRCSQTRLGVAEQSPDWSWPLSVVSAFMASMASCECWAEEQIADHIITFCPIYCHSNGVWGLLTEP